MTHTRAALLIGTASLAAALVATLVPAPEAQAAAARTPWWCVTCGGAGVADWLLNLLLLLPLGIAARIGRLSLWRTAALCAGVSTAIEVMQGVMIVGRDASLGDVVANTAGGISGWLLTQHWRAVSQPSPRTARAVAAVLAIGLAGTGVIALRGLRPAMSLADFTRVRFAPAAVGRPTFAGVVTSFALNGTTYGDRAVPAALPPADVLAVAAFTWARSRPGTATIVRIDGAGGDAVLSLDVRGSLLRADLHTRAASLGLRSAPVGVRLPASLRPGDAVRVEFRWSGNSVTLAATAPGGPRLITTGTFRPWHAWVLLNPFTGTMQFDSKARGWTVAWLGTWLLVIGWFLRRWLMDHRGRLTKDG